jgi:hypothetical protein
VAIAGVWTQCTYKVKEAYRWYRSLFSVAAEVLTMVATGVVYQQLGGPTVPLHAAGLAKPLWERSPPTSWSTPAWLPVRSP